MTSDAHGHTPRGPQGQPPRPAIHPKNPAIHPKNPAMGVLLSAFVPGLGSMMSGNVGIGVTILVLNIAGWFLVFSLIGIPITIGTWIWGMADAYLAAQKWNRVHGIIT